MEELIFVDLNKECVEGNWKDLVDVVVFMFGKMDIIVCDVSDCVDVDIVVIIVIVGFLKEG